MSAVQPNAIRSDAPRPATVVVTGASGWLGQNLVRALAHDRQRVRCLVPADNEAPVFEGVGPASVFHAAAVIHPQKHTREFFDVNVGGTQLVLDRARRAGAVRCVHVSSNSPFGANPTSTHQFTEDSPYN